MPKATRSPEEIDAVKEKILNCAFEILVKNGFERLSMARIGAKMKMTAANLYNYYSNTKMNCLLPSIKSLCHVVQQDKLCRKGATALWKKLSNMAYAC